MRHSKMPYFHRLPTFLSLVFITQSIALNVGPYPRPMPMLEKRNQTVVNYCPEQFGEAMQLCDDPACGGDTKEAGFCDKIRRSGLQTGCLAPGCGSYCRCMPTHGERPFPTDQVPFQLCPEALGRPIKKCSDCGGDSKVHGVCDDILLNGSQSGCLPGGCGYHCQCDSNQGTGSAPPPGTPTKLVTSVVDDQTITATFQATTLSEWKDLKSHTTITTSVSSTETELAVAVFAGGVAWWLLGQSAAGAVLTPPPAAPEGSEEDDKKCSPEPKCKDLDCGGANAVGLCKSGDKANCPCKDEQECPADPPQCTVTECGGSDDQLKCNADGKLKDCHCCPSEQPQCDDEGCDGKDSKCEAEKLKGCSCAEATIGPPLLFQRRPSLVSQFEIEKTAWEIFQTLFGGDRTKLGGGNEDHPSGKPQCSEKSVSGVPEQLVTDIGKKSPNDLQYLMREVLCNDKCETPAGIRKVSVVATPDNDGCEITIILPDNVEAYSYRGTHAQGAQWQDCWDSLANITESCIKNGPNTGWVNGPDDHEFFQAGFRVLNGVGSKHGQLDGSKALRDANDHRPLLLPPPLLPPSPPSPPSPPTNSDCPVIPCPAGKSCPDPIPCDKLSCEKDCCGGSIPNPTWCDLHCKTVC